MTATTNTGIKHVFLLMLENRSFDFDEIMKCYTPDQLGLKVLPIAALYRQLG